MVVNCEQVWREISNYLEGDIEPGLRAAMEEHVRGCEHCTAVLDGTRNVVQLYGDERMIEVPLGFGQRLQRRLEENQSRWPARLSGMDGRCRRSSPGRRELRGGQVLRLQPS